MKNRYWPWVTIILALLSLVFCLDLPKANAQGGAAGGILGNVTDQTGAAIPDAEVTITNIGTQQSRVVHTDQAGSYDVEALLASGTSYNVTVTKAGFETFISQGLKLDAGMRVAVNAQLKLGTGSTQVTVEANAVQVQTESGTTGAVITRTEIQEIQLNGRNFVTFELLTPGVNPTDSAQEQTGGGLTTFNNNSVSGLPPAYSTTLIDGTWNMNTGGQSELNVFPAMDSIAEFRVLTSAFSAKYTLSGNGFMDVETKSGTKDFHGSADEYFRNDAMDSRNFFLPTTSPLHQSIFGGTIGGPVFIPNHYNTDKSKTFFFVSEEFRQRFIGEVTHIPLPTSAMISGDFSNVPGFPGQRLSLDQSSQAILAQEFPGVNCLTDSTHINPQCISKNAALEAGVWWPTPTTPGQYLNFNVAPVEAFTQREELFRVDHRFNDKYSLVARVAHEIAHDNAPFGSQALGWSRPGPEAAVGDRILTTGFNNMIRFNMQMSPSINNTITLAQTDDKPRINTTPNNDFISGTSFNFPFGYIDHYKRSPQITFADGYADMGAANTDLHASDGEQTYFDDLVVVKGHHVLQMGADYLRGIKRQDLPDCDLGCYSFGGAHTGSPISDFLLGLDANFSQTNAELRYYAHYNRTDQYFQDDWKATRRLTINMGLRNEYLGPEWGELPATDFNPSLFNPAVAPAITPAGSFVFNAEGQELTATGAVANLENGMVFRGQKGVSRGVYKSPWFTPQPVLGFAYALGGNGKTVIRGGGTFGYNEPGFGNYVAATEANYPWETTETFLNGSLASPTLGAPSQLTPFGLTIAGPPGSEMKYPRISNYNLTVERQFGNGIASIAYMGSGARHMSVGMDLNYPRPVAAPSVSNPACLQPGESANPAGGFNFDPCLNAGVVSSDITRTRFPGYANITTWADFAPAGDFANINYNSLQMAYRYTGRHGLTLMAAYTYQRAMGEYYTGTNQNPGDLAADYGPVTYNRKQMLNFSYVYDLPILRGRKDLAGKAFGGWTVAGLTTIESGFPLTMGLTGLTGLANRPNCIGNVNGSRSLSQWFNTAAFAMPAYGFYGSCGNGLVTGPGLNNWNAALYKTFPIGERLKAQIRGEFFNIPNHPSMSGVSTTLGSGNFGEVTSALQPRIVELAARFDF